MSADAARLLAARQRVRNRVFVVVAAAAAMLDAALIVVAVAAISRAVTDVVVTSVVLATLVAVSVVHARLAAGRVEGGLPDAEQSATLLPIVTRLAEGLGIEVPRLWIAYDDAVNAFSAYSGSNATVFYTRGFLEEFGRPGDVPLIEAVTAHLMARIASGDNGVTVAAAGLLNWALFLFRWVVLGFAKVLRLLGWGYVTSDAHRNVKPADNYSDDLLNRFVVWGVSVFLGLCLLMASLVIVLAGGILVLVAGGVRLGLARQRTVIADSIAARLTGDPQALRAVLGRFSGIRQRDDRHIELARSEQVLDDLCFDSSSIYGPDLLVRASRVLSTGSAADPGTLLPVASGLAVACLVGGAAVLAARIPYGQPFSSAGSASPQASQGQAIPVSTGSGQATASPAIPVSPPGGQPSSRTGRGTGSTPTPHGSSPSPKHGNSPSQLPPAPVPAVPGSVSATAVGQFTIQVTWAESSPQVSGFNIDNGCPVGSCGPGATLAQTTGPVTSTEFTVTPGSYQCFRVRAFDASGASEWSGYGCTSTPPLVLTGGPDWTDTGVDVTAGIELGLSASGTMTVDGGLQVDPSGDQSCIPEATYPDANPPFIAPALHCWALIARIGYGSPFEIGATFTSIIGQTGRLYLVINGDSPTAYPGTWTVEIKKGGAA
jgi:Zn-dependent protease with chaperone function